MLRDLDQLRPKAFRRDIGLADDFQRSLNLQTVQRQFALKPFNDFLLRLGKVCRLPDDCLQLLWRNADIDAGAADVAAHGDTAGLGFDLSLFSLSLNKTNRGKQGGACRARDSKMPSKQTHSFISASAQDRRPPVLLSSTSNP